MADRTILYIAPRIPYPLTDGMALRQFHLLRAYAAVGRVKLVFLYRDEAQLQAGTPLGSYCDSLHPVPLSSVYRPLSKDAPLWRRRLEQAASLTPSIASMFASSEMQRVVESLAPSADLVHIAKLWMIPNAGRAMRPRERRMPVVLDLDDVETVVKKRALKIDPPERWQRRLYERYDLMRLRLYQHRALRLADRAFVCSARDQRRLRRSNVVVIPNGATIPPQTVPDESDGKTLLCAGNLRYGPNVDGVLFFVRQVLPLIRREVPAVQLLVVGRAPADEVRRLDDGGRVRVVGDVPQMEPYYRQSTAAVVCLRVGGGTRLRILEAFSLGRPVVSTSIGCEGLEVTNDEHLLVADDPSGLAQACGALLKRPELRRRLVARGRALVEEKYNWEAIEARVSAVATELLTEVRG